MEALLILLLLAAPVAGVVWYLRRRRAEQADEAEAAERDAPREDPFAGTHGNEDLLYGLRPRDVVAYHSADYLVRGSIRFDEGGYTWAEHLISDDRTQYWLGVENDEGLSVTLWQRIPAAEVDGEPGAKSLPHGEITYELQEQGEAGYEAEGTTGTATSGTAGYADYRGPGGELLSCERFGRSWEISLGEAKLPRAFDIYPRSP